MKPLLQEIRHNPLLWLLALVPVVFAAAKLRPEAHSLLFLIGNAFGRIAEYRAWLTGLAMVVLGCVLVAITMALGG